MRWTNGSFLEGLLALIILSSLLLLLIPEDKQGGFLAIMKMAVGLWIIQKLFLLFGHSLS